MDGRPTLRGKYIVLEPLVLNHAEALAASLTPEDDVFQLTTTAPRTPAEMRAWIEARNTPRAGLQNLAFAQRDLASGLLMGSTSLFDLDEVSHCVEIGHTWLTAPFRRTAANTEAKLLLMTHAFDRLGVKRVQIVTDERNERSQRAIARLGAVREGILRNHRKRIDGSLRNSVYFSVIDTEWQAVRARLESLLTR